MRTAYENRNLGHDFGDARLHRRFKAICAKLEQGLNATIPQLCHKRSSAKSFYRFFDNKAVNTQKMLRDHRDEIEACLACIDSNRLLQVSDSSELDFTGKKGGPKLGSLNYKHQRGMLVHNSLLLSDGGLPLGLLWQSYVVRKDEDFGKSAERRYLPIEEKESYRWLEHFKQGQAWLENEHTKNPDLELVYVADSEADILELFQLRNNTHMHLLVRSKHDRALAANGEDAQLYSRLDGQPLQGSYVASIADPATQKVRQAMLDVRYCPLQLTRRRKSKHENNLPVVELNALQIKEKNPPPDVEPIKWVLLTTLPILCLEDALQIIEYYLLRWLIERFHYLMKSGGAEVEKLQLQTAHRLQNAITTYSIATFKAFKLRYWAENSPQSTIRQAGISETEHKVLYTYAHQKVDKKITYDPKAPPTVAQYCKTLGQIGGFFPSKRQELPGLKIISRALSTLQNLVDAYLILCQRTE